ncbi:endopeptidase [Bacillus cereus]|nr:endopeptidase [Bacillus cereus]PGU62636.1 endopeptidase [Bacillus cereus]
MITLYKPNETDFTHNGIGILDANIYDAVVEETLNGLFILTFKYPLFAPHGLEIDGQCLIKVPTPDGEQLFRVANPKPSMGEITVFCYHVFYDLVDNLIEDTFIENKSGQAALDQIASKTQYAHNFKFFTDIKKVASSRLVRKNPIEAILDVGQDNCFLNRWGGELQRDNFKVNILLNRGKDRGVEIQHKKDLLGYEGDVDWQSPITRIMPKGFNGLLLPEKYIDSPNIKKYVNPKIRVVEFEHIKAAIDDNANDDDAVPLEEAYKLLRQAAKDLYEVQKVDQPQATYKVEFQELTQTEEYKNFAVLQRVYMADTITVKHEEDNVNIQAKIISYKYDPIKEEYIHLTMGNFKESFADIGNKVDQMGDRIKDDISGMETSFLDKAKEEATNLINSGFGGHVRVYPDKILIMDTKDEKTAKKVWQWNLNGLGYSKTGINGPYGLAITSDGSIVADYITTGTLTAALLKTGVAKGNNLTIDFDSGSVSFQKGTIQRADGKFKINIDNGSIESNTEKGGFILKDGQIILSGKGNEEYGKLLYDWTNAGASLKGKVRWDVSSYDAEYGFGVRKSKGTGMYGQSNFSYLFAENQLMITAGDEYTVQGSIKSVPNIYIFDDRISLTGNRVEVVGSFRAIGEKNAVHVTRDGVRATPAYETTESYLGDIGTGVTDENGQAIIAIDEIFSDTVNTSIEYQVFISPYSRAMIWVSAREENYFVVESSEPGAKFVWEIKAKRRGYENDRLNLQDDLTNDEVKKLFFTGFDYEEDFLKKCIKKGEINED